MRRHHPHRPAYLAASGSGAGRACRGEALLPCQRADGPVTQSAGRQEMKVLVCLVRAQVRAWRRTGVGLALGCVVLWGWEHPVEAQIFMQSSKVEVMGGVGGIPEVASGSWYFTPTLNVAKNTSPRRLTELPVIRPGNRNVFHGFSFSNALRISTIASERDRVPTTVASGRPNHLANLASRAVVCRHRSTRTSKSSSCRSRYSP